MAVHIPPLKCEKAIDRQVSISVTLDERLKLHKESSKRGMNLTNYVRAKLGFEPLKRIKQTFIVHPENANRIILEG